MRILKIMLITVAILVSLVVGGYIVDSCLYYVPLWCRQTKLYSYLYYAPHWYQKTKLDSIAVLEAARSTPELTNAVGSLGLYISLTNGGWIAIRYRDIHSSPIVSCTVARDSGGGWFESHRHFCGRLGSWPRLKEEAAAAANGMVPSYREMIAIESAPDLERARAALREIGFTRFTK